jgi:NADP-dependent 3-hydroxy acid dehydrogenase YdfG
MVSSRLSRAPTSQADATDLAGKSIIISGGTTGIGRATGHLLAAQGARVFVFGRHDQDLRETIGTAGTREGNGLRGEIHGTVADQSKQEEVERVFAEADEKIGGCDILINNAAVAGGSVFEKRIPDIRYVLDANLFGYLACTHEALERMKRKGRGGHIVNVGSMSADLREPEGDIYVATKAAVQAFSESLRKTANKQGIRVSLIEPGAIATPIQDKPPEEKQRRLENMEMLPPEDIANCVLYVLRQPQRCDVVSVQIRPLKQLI